MAHNALTNNKPTITVKPDALLKVITLLDLQDALCKEAYEACPALIQKALSYGARKREISEVLTKYRKKAKAERLGVKDRLNGGGRLRL